MVIGGRDDGRSLRYITSKNAQQSNSRTPQNGRAIPTHAPKLTLAVPPSLPGLPVAVVWIAMSAMRFCGDATGESIPPMLEAYATPRSAKLFIKMGPNQSGISRESVVAK